MSQLLKHLASSRIQLLGLVQDWQAQFETAQAETQLARLREAETRERLSQYQQALLQLESAISVLDTREKQGHDGQPVLQETDSPA